MYKNKINTLLFLLVSTILLYSCQGQQKPVPVTAPVTQSGYDEQYRPQFHFSPPQQWMNDPNGMVYFDGEYHLFYQHYPDSNVWGPMHWAHAISKDMVHWENLPIALFPDSLGYIFSGSAVVDRNNTSGFGENGQPPLVAMFTYHDMAGEKAGRKDYQSQAIAYSNDRGRTWKKYSGNPVLPNPGNVKDIRDPKLIWDNSSQQWVVTLAVGDHVEFWGSPNLKNWSHLSNFGKEYGGHGGVWECPDLFPVQVDASTDKKWVLIVNINPGAPNGGSGTQYFIGNFDGKNFVMDPSFAKNVEKGNGVWLDYGKDNYAGVTWSDVPESDGRRLLLGWMSNWEYATVVPTKAWRSACTVPRALILKNTPEGYRLSSQPVKELESLRAISFIQSETTIAGSLDLTSKTGFSPAQSEWILDFDISEAPKANLGVELSNTKGEIYRIGFDAAKHQFYSDRTQSGDHSFSTTFASGIHTAPRTATDKTVQLHLFFDVSSAELFADGGATAMTELFFPTENFNQVKIYATGGKVRLTKASAWQLKSIWK
jgi:fructan beta-fructosidase